MTVFFIEAQDIELVSTEKIAAALEMSYGGRIAILPGQSEAEESPVSQLQPIPHHGGSVYAGVHHRGEHVRFGR